MTKRSVAAVLLLLGSAVPAAGQQDGAFTLRQSDKDARINLNLQDGDGRNNHGRMFNRSEFSDVSQSGDRITFALRRAPGTFAFEGRGSMDRAAGWYVFSPSAEFRRDLERIGFRDVDDRALFTFALDDLTVAKARQLQGLISDTIDTPGLVRLINHGAGVTYIQAMTDAGFAKLSSNEYRRARDHGVTAQFARDMADLGTKSYSLPELVRLRDHGVSAEFVKGMRAEGFDVTFEELVRARDHGVSVEFVRRMRALGYKDLSLAEYVRMRDHGVTPDFAEAMKDAGLGALSARDLTRLRDHGVSAAYVRRLKEQLKESPSVEQVIRYRSRGWDGRN